jgi:hypothetical protein
MGPAPEVLVPPPLSGFVPWPTNDADGHKTDAQATACYRGTLQLASGHGRAQRPRGQPKEARSMPGCLGAVGMDADRREQDHFGRTRAALALN